MGLKSCLEKYVDFNGVAVASTSLGAELLGRIYVFYYLKVFLNVYSLNEFWLNVAQTLYLIWNAINDPIFGYMMDVGCCEMKWIMNRRKVILYGGPFYAIFFMIPWIPWTSTGEPSWLVGVHLIVSLVLYDGILSLVISAQLGLLTELTTKHSGRVRTVIYMEICRLIGSFVIFPVDAISKSVTNYKTFQITISVIAMISMLFFYYTGYYATDEVAQVQNNDPETSLTSTTEICIDKKSTFSNSLQAIWTNSKGILTNQNFWSVVSGHYFRMLRFTANSNFLAIFTETLVSRNGVLPVGSFGLSIYYTFCNCLPKVVVILSWPFLRKFGAWNIMMCFCILTMINSIISFSIGQYNYISILSCLLFESVLSQSIWPCVYNIFFSDVIDEDMKINNRSHPFSTTIFTMNALFTKPAISLAPMIIVAILNTYRYETFQAYRKQAKNNFLDSTVTEMTSNDMNVLTNAMFGVVCWFPAICAIVEMICFIRYKMKFKHREEAYIEQNDCTNMELV